MSDLCSMFTHIFTGVNIKKYIFLYIVFIFVNSEYFPDTINGNYSDFGKGLFLILLYMILEIFINLEIL